MSYDKIEIGFFVVGACLGARDKIAFQVSLNPAHYYMENGNHKDAIKEYSSMIEKEPDVYGFYVNKAILLVDMSDYDMALAAFKDVKAINSNDSELYYNMVYLYNLMGNKTLEEECIEKATALEFDID